MNSNLDVDSTLAPTALQQPLDGEQSSSVAVSLDHVLRSGFIENQEDEKGTFPSGLKFDMHENSFHEGAEESVEKAFLSQGNGIEKAAGFPSPEGSAPEVTMGDLFGAFFEIDKSDGPAPNPLLVDTRGILKSMFGPCVNEEDIIFQNPEDLLRETMQQNKDLHIFDAQVELFGEHGAQVLTQEKPEGFHLLYASVPEVPPLADADQTWLLEMPKMAPNRQILHADPQPFLPSHCPHLESNSRMLYTPSNILRWGHHTGQGLYLSNARVVRWSDLSLTLHVGSDVHSLLPAKGNAPVSLLGNATTVRKTGVALPAIATTLLPDRHFVVESSEAGSIERAVFEASAQRNVETHRRRLPYTITTLPEIDWAKPKSRNPVEEFVMMQYEQRQKVLDRRLKEGRPMSLREQLDLDAELLSQLHSPRVEALMRGPPAGPHGGAKRPSTHGNPAGRLERDLGLISARDGGELPAGEPTSEAEPTSRSSSHAEDDNEADGYEAMLDAMRKKRAREGEEAAEARRQHVERHEREVSERFAPLLTALEDLAQKLPMGTDAYGSVDGTVEFIRSGVFAPSIVEKEVPAMLQEVAEELPGVDTTAVRDAFLAIFSNIQV
ncbi:unnamed protein product [Phytomonas sp. EM1]|nr:unnamed protein product [Phytomonas sp. EM1]|eukprot:CCW62127.1 unnamed protein product [Phytomonas sp. isolate EM1]